MHGVSRESVADLRRDYARAGLAEADLAATWLEQFERWFGEAAGLLEPNAVVLATASPDAVPSARTVGQEGDLLYVAAVLSEVEAFDTALQRSDTDPKGGH